jgi:hypothetical protein
MKLGAIVRSCEERTERLCIDSLKRELYKGDIKIIRNVHPFKSTLQCCYATAIQEEFDWYLCVDADMVMVRGWREMLEDRLRSLGDRVESEKIWELNFKLKDVVDPNPIGDLRVINNKYSNELFYSHSQIKDSVKPEAAICANIIKRLKVTRAVFKNIIAYHGFNQYKRDVFNRFYIRACRDTSYVRKRGLFKEPLSSTEKIAKSGWEYGLKHREAKSLNANNKIDVEKLGYKELPPLNFDLSCFYRIRDEENAT